MCRESRACRRAARMGAAAGRGVNVGTREENENMNAKSLAKRSRRRRIFISGPYTGEEMQDVREGILKQSILLNAGYAVYCPHLSAFAQLVVAESEDLWVQQAMEWMRECDAVLRIGEAEDEEVAMAEELFLPVWNTLELLFSNEPTWVPLAKELGKSS